MTAPRHQGHEVPDRPPLSRPGATLPVLLLLVGVLRAPPAGGAVTITDATDEGIACFKVVTDSATYFYDKAGAGFTSLLDKAGGDWIDFHPQGGASGHYRGIPNMGLNVFGHPGYTGATSTTTDPKGTPLPQATITSTKGGWKVSWEFFPSHATMTVHSVAENYWLLYEGTPGGAVGADDTLWRSDGKSFSCSAAFEGDIPNSSGAVAGYEWIYVADGKVDRSIFLAHTDDSITDRYYLMSPMTVFGFGRQAANTNRLLSATPVKLIIGLVETRDFAAVKTHLDGIVKGKPPAKTPAELREAIDKVLRQRREGQATDQEVQGQIKAYRNL